MSEYEFLTTFPFSDPELPVSLSHYAPVFRVRDRRGDWVVKPTDVVHSDGEAITAWLVQLSRRGVGVVAPVSALTPNPRLLEDGKSWVVYPHVNGEPYVASVDQLTGAGSLLGQMHVCDPVEAAALATFESPVVRSVDWIGQHGVLSQSFLSPFRLRGIGLCLFGNRQSGRLPFHDQFQG